MWKVSGNGRQGREDGCEGSVKGKVKKVEWMQETWEVRRKDTAINRYG